MDLKFIQIGNKGKDDEFILFQAINDCNLRDYLVHDNTFDADGELSNKLRHMYRFNRSVVAKKNEYVAIKVKQSGKYVMGTYSKTSPCHIFYWGVDHDIFNKDGDKLYLLRIAETLPFPV